jgi:hypothetical protein
MASKAEWRKRIYSGLVEELNSAIDVGAEWIFLDDNDGPISDVDDQRVREVIAEIQDAFRKKARGMKPRMGSL